MGRFSRSRIRMEKDDFSKVLKRGKRSGDGLLLVTAGRNEVGFSRLGMALPKKHLRRATLRSRMKRLIREDFYRLQPFAVAMDVVVVSRPAMAHYDKEVIRESLHKHWRNVERKLGDARG